MLPRRGKISVECTAGAMRKGNSKEWEYPSQGSVCTGTQAGMLPSDCRQRSFPPRKRTGKKMVSGTLEPLEAEVERCETTAGASSFSLHGELLAENETKGMS